MASATNNRGAVATVRIAPVERWCEPMLKEYQRQEMPQLIGMAAAININSMRTGKECVNSCESREWLLETSPALAFRGDVGIGPHDDTNVWICEHMLEMD